MNYATARFMSSRKQFKVLARPLCRCKHYEVRYISGLNSMNFAINTSQGTNISSKWNQIKLFPHACLGLSEINAPLMGSRWKLQELRSKTCSTKQYNRTDPLVLESSENENPFASIAKTFSQLFFKRKLPNQDLVQAPRPLQHSSPLHRPLCHDIS